MSAARSCSVCEKPFEPRFRFQVEETEGRTSYYCTQKCQQSGALRAAHEGVECAGCGARFRPEFAWQLRVSDAGRRYFCSEPCLSRDPAKTPQTQGPLRVAVFNHKGGTGKTTTAVNVAAGLAETGRRVLLVDVDPQGNVAVALGVKSERGLYHVLVLGADVRTTVVSARKNLDVITSNETLAAAELYLAGRPNRDRVLRERLVGSDAYDAVVLDCSPSLSLLNQNALAYADGVLIPVSCDYLALVGVQQVIKTLRNVHEHLKHPIRILGAVPTFYDARQKIAREVVETLREKFGELCFPEVRANIKLREAPAARQSIFEYAPDSFGAEDYRAIVTRLLHDTRRDAKPEREAKAPRGSKGAAR